jgi:hypothetical protein
MCRWLFLLVLSGCATARVVGPSAYCPPDPKIERTVVIEPFFEVAQWETSTHTEYARVYGSSLGGYGGFGVGFGMGTGGFGRSQTVAITRQVTEKPMFAQADALAVQHSYVLHAIHKLRPSWRVSSTSGITAEGPVTVVRTIIQGHDVIESNRALHNLAFGFGLIIWPLQLVNINPVTEQLRVYGALERYTTDTATVQSRLVRYPTQPDAAFNASGFTPDKRQFGLDVIFEEGVMANETPRKAVLLQGFAERLAVAIVALVEEP